MFLPSMLKQQFKSKLMAQGIGRHSRNEIYHYGMKDLRAIVDQLGAKPFLMGDRVSLVDTTAYAFVSSLLINEFTSPIDELSKTAENLRAYRDRMQNLYFPELNYSRRDDLASV
jgi:glutathione S-transferase